MKSRTALPPFQLLIDMHGVAVTRFMRGMLPRQEVDDAVQETFLAALRAYPSFDGANPRGWLLTIARRKAIDEYRSRSRRPEPLQVPDAVEAPNGDGLGRAEADAMIWTAVADLPRKQRAAIVLRFALDLRYREVGEALDCSEAAARRSVHEGIARLRREIEPTKRAEVTG